jgi:hypothetical protein
MEHLWLKLTIINNALITIGNVAQSSESSMDHTLGFLINKHDSLYFQYIEYHVDKVAQ